MTLNVTLIAETLMDEALLQPARDETTIDLRATRTTGEWERPALVKVSAQPLDLADDPPSPTRRPSLLTRTLGIFTR